MDTNALFSTDEHEGSSYYLLCYKNKMFPIVSYIGYVFKYHTQKTQYEWNLSNLARTFFVALHQKNWSYIFIKMKYIFIDKILDVC